jgi:predicted unusual protein kinase regulating ubiquinone biosynthesis (AarF/ABC1/UbiB family)
MFAGMRGAAMKVGQTLSAVDLGLVPEEIRPQWQEILATLQQDANPVSFKAITKVIEDDLGEKLSDVFTDIDPEPIAAASIGQVHKAQLDDGRIVAVKVQYPGIAEAIYADMQNMRLGLKLLSVIAPGIDTSAIADEIRERIGEELDYELEAANHRDVARMYRGHPFIVVPDVVTSLSRERVIVTEFVDGVRFAAVKDRPQAERNRLGEILCRFYINGPLRHRLLNGDPHPGNSLFLDDGRVAFLDFGFFKHLSETEVAQIIATDRATYERDGAELMRQLAAMGGLPPNPALEQPFLEAYTAIFGWIFSREPLMVETSKTAEMMRTYTQLRNSEGFGDLVLPAEHIVLMRSTMLLIGLLGQLRATNPWFDIGAEWLLGEEPVTELGRQEAAFFGGRVTYPTAVAAV